MKSPKMVKRLYGQTFNKNPQERKGNKKMLVYGKNAIDLVIKNVEGITTRFEAKNWLNANCTPASTTYQVKDKTRPIKDGCEQTFYPVVTKSVMSAYKVHEELQFIFVEKF
jgi:hypothetical protein